jgi:transposase
MGALDVRRGKPFGFASHEHNSDTFIELLDLIDAVYPPGRGHIIMDNLSAHDTPDVNEWFDEHPRWTRHFTPKHASWLNQIECWFSLLSRHVLARSFASTDDLAAKIDAVRGLVLRADHPFRWSYRPKSWRESRRRVRNPARVVVVVVVVRLQS